jgi:excisionase family DNA binding protein
MRITESPQGIRQGAAPLRRNEVTMQQAFLTITDFCTQYRVSRGTVYRQINAGLIPTVKIGRITRIRASDAERWAAGLPAGTKKTSNSRQKLVMQIVSRFLTGTSYADWSKVLRLLGLMFRLFGFENEN